MSHIIEKVPFISQLEKYPTGCESVSAVMALAYKGIPVTVEEFIDEYLPKGPAPQPDPDQPDEAKATSDQPDEASSAGNAAKPVLIGPDPWEVFPGDPYSTHGWGCFAPALKKAIEKCLEKKGTGLNPVELYHTPIETLCHDYIDRDIPVIFWATIGMAKAHESLVWRSATRVIHWMSPMHCTLLIGYETAAVAEDCSTEGTPATITHYIFNDPTSGERAVFPAAAVEEAYHAQGEQALVLL
ncbi:MAG: C39 family peptidase [Firmicutes bacterium]|nr:C39 family peptidase [Bacillota bacterium]